MRPAAWVRRAGVVPGRPMARWAALTVRAGLMAPMEQAGPMEQVGLVARAAPVVLPVWVGRPAREDRDFPVAPPDLVVRLVVMAAPGATPADPVRLAWMINWKVDPRGVPVPAPAADRPSRCHPLSGRS